MDRRAVRRVAAASILTIMSSSLGSKSRPVTSGPSAAAPAAFHGAVFDDRDPAEIRVSTARLEVAISKANGAILSIVDRVEGGNLTLGSRRECLWGVVFPAGTLPDEYVGGCYYTTNGRSFAYHWDDSSSELVLDFYWAPGEAQGVDTVVTLRFEGEHHFDALIDVHNRWSNPIESVLFPSDLLFQDRETSGAHGTFVLPGIRLSSAFFEGGKPFTATYPSAHAFGDFLSLDVAGSHLAFYSVNPSPQPVRPVTIGFFDDDEQGQAGTYFVYRRYQTYVPRGATWRSPVVRVQVGKEARSSIEAYRRDNRIDAYPSLDEKLPSRLRELKRAALVKAGVEQVGRPLRDWMSVAQHLSPPLLIHAVGFQPGGFDQNYPDFLPPEARWGTNADFRDMIDHAHERGMFVMPYTNPTWWDDESPTMRSLSAHSVAVLDVAGQPVYEWYPPDSPKHGGYVISPAVQPVRDRLAALMTQWRREVPVDCVFEDQIGARPWMRDHNPGAPGIDSYADGWLAHVRRNKDICLMTEMGWDRLAELEVGFHGTVEVGFAGADGHWGRGNWEPYPLAQWLFGDKVLMYQHNLAPETLSDHKETLTFNLAFGMMMSYAWPVPSAVGSTAVAWVDLANWLQRNVAARYAGRRPTGFDMLVPQVSESRYEDLRVIANWSDSSNHVEGAHTLSPGGFLATTDDESIVAGVFEGAFNGASLSPGDHIILVERSAERVTIRQPFGQDTDLAVKLPTTWRAGSGLEVHAYSSAGQRLGEAEDVAADWSNRRVTLLYARSLHGTAVAYYEVMPTVTPPPVYLPSNRVGF